MEMSKKMLYLMCLATIILFPLLAAIVIYFFLDVSFVDILTIGEPLKVQLLKGMIYGLISASVALWLVQLKVLKKATDYFIGMFKNLKLTYVDIVFFSLCAGIGEEIFFRGAIQPLLGVWLTAFIFIAIHGYLSFTDLSINIYGSMMVVIVAGFGFLTLKYGIWAAIMAHFIFDVIVFIYIKWYNQKHFDQETDVTTLL